MITAMNREVKHGLNYRRHSIKAAADAKENAGGDAGVKINYLRLSI